MPDTSDTKVIVNGVLLSVERANSVMFVQCTMLKKKFTIDTDTSPIHVKIEGYHPDTNDAKPDATDATNGVPGLELPPQTPAVRKCGTCNEPKNE